MHPALIAIFNGMIIIFVESQEWTSGLSLDSLKKLPIYKSLMVGMVNSISYYAEIIFLSLRTFTSPMG